MELKVEYVPIEDIKPYENNAKLHPAFQIEQIKKSIQEFGFAAPCSLWHGEVVEGHGRLLAAQKLGMKVIPCIKLDTLTDEQRRAYGLIHNKLTMNSDFDLDILQEELDDITGIDMEDFGFLDDLDIGEPKEPDEATINEEYNIVIECNSEEELEKTFNELQGQGYNCKIST